MTCLYWQMDGRLLKKYFKITFFFYTRWTEVVSYLMLQVAELRSFSL